MKKSDVHVLIVDDDKSIQAVLTEAAKRQGFSVTAVAKPSEAESLVKIKPFHALIVDVMLPGKNGVDFLEEIKDNLSEECVVTLMSGVYRDPSYIQQALQRSGAAEYLVKPFDILALFNKLESKLVRIIEKPKLELRTLMSASHVAGKERRKALDQVEDISGYDLPFIFCILMDTESSGYLNIVDEDHNIYGVTFSGGKISHVDSETTVHLVKNILSHYGFLSDLEISKIKANSSSHEYINELVEQGHMSPHVPGLLKIETIANELRNIVSSKKIKINFVPNRKLKPEPNNVDAADFALHLHNIIDKQIPSQWLKEQYDHWAGHLVKPGPQLNEFDLIKDFEIIKRVPGLIELCKTSTSIDQITTKLVNVPPVDILKAIHFLMLKRVLMFEDVKRDQNVVGHISRVRNLHKDLMGKKPHEIFAFFGLNSEAKASEITKLYKEFAKTHHPDTLPAQASAEIKTLNHELFSLVTAAHEILTNPNKRSQYQDEIKQKGSDLQFKVEEMISSASQHLQRSQYDDAYKILKNASELQESERVLMHLWWAKIKSSQKIEASLIAEYDTKLKNMAPAVKSSALWSFVYALVRRAQNDIPGAAQFLKKAMSIEPDFAEARREFAALKSAAEAAQPKKLTTEEILTGDLTTVVKALFNRKKGA